MRSDAILRPTYPRPSESPKFPPPIQKRIADAMLTSSKKVITAHEASLKNRMFLESKASWKRLVNPNAAGR